ncbi:MAG: alpha/beta hydrolase [Nocardioides sp.]
MTPALRGALSVLLLMFAAGCGGGSEDTEGSGDAGGSSGEQIEIGGAEALMWGDGDYGVVLAHGAAFDAASWEEQAERIADGGATVVAVEDISPEGIEAAVEQLQEDGIDDVALVGGSAGADAILQLVSAEPDLPDQLILLSPNSTVDGLGEQPKLFIASEDEPVADVSRELAESAPGGDNEALILPGSAHAQNIFDSDQGDDVLDVMLERLAR